GGVGVEAVPNRAPPMRWNRRVGVERKAMSAGTARTGESWRLALRTKARADAAHVLAGPFAISDALLHRGRHSAREFWCGVAQGVIPGGHRGLHTHFQIAQPAELADH